MKSLKFWGTRGSCSVSGDAYKRFGGNTCCLEVNYEGTHLLIDAGTGIRPLGHLLDEEGVRKIDLFLGHTHWDHIIGFPFFELIYRKGTQITIWSPAGESRSSREIFKDLLSKDFFPVSLDQVQSQIDFRTIHANSPIQIGPLTIDFHPAHHTELTYCFKIKTPHQTIGYVTDNEMLKGYHGEISQIPPALLEPYEALIHFLKGCDILIHEAQYFPEEYLKKVGWGHSSVRNAIALIQRAKPAQWLVTHHDPQHSDADLDRLCHLAKTILHENRIPLLPEWIEDGRTIQLV